MPDRRTSPTITWSELGVKVTAQYSRDGLAVSTDPQRVVRLRCTFQKLEGEATRQGLWLNSTAEGKAADRLRVVADAVGRNHRAMVSLAGRGVVEREAGLVRFVRAYVQEEYSVSADGVRQDFVIPQSPVGSGQLRLELGVTGARAEAVAEGAKLVLKQSGRKLAYDRLRVNDAAGKELPAKLEVVSGSRLAVLVDDSNAAYPIRIDPTFSDANWVSMGGYPGVDGAVYAAVVDDSGNLYIGGYFTAVGGIIATNVAKWNGTNWSALGFSITGWGAGGGVNALAFSGNTLYVGGSFTNACGIPANRIVQWDGTNWSALGSGLGGGGWPQTGIRPWVLALAVSGSDLYAGGWFTTAGDTDASYVAKWDGSSWSPLGSGMDTAVGTLAVSGTDLYAGGQFTTADGIVCNGIAKWDGSGWSALGSGVSGDAGSVRSLAISGTELYAGGRFTHANGILVNGIAKWDGNTWSPLGSGMETYTSDGRGGTFTTIVGPDSLVMFGGNLYAGGRFTNAGGVTCYGAAKWDGQSWSSLGAGVGILDTLDRASVRALVSANGSLYVGGGFSLAGDVAATGIAEWSGTNWSALANGLNRGLAAWAVSGDQVYAGGAFQGVGPERVSFIARWNGSGWSAVGSGLSGPVACLASSGTELYAAGSFETNGLSVNYVSKWNGSQWTSLGTPPDRALALAVFQGQLHVGGWPFGVAKWSGTNWSSVGTVGSSFYGPFVQALVSDGNFLFAGGYFTAIGGTSANNVAMWDGISWSALGSGMTGAETNPPRVFCLTMGSTGRDLYAGGIFYQVGNAFAKNIARWDGTNWSALGSGVVAYSYTPDGSITAMVASEGDLYVSGGFETAGGISATNFAKWNGSRWSALGSGIIGGGPLAIAGGELLVGGYAGSNLISAFAARAYLERPTLAIKKTGANVTLSWPTFYSDFVLEQNASLANPNGWTAAEYPLVTNGAIKSATTSLTPTNRFFRLVE